MDMQFTEHVSIIKNEFIFLFDLFFFKLFFLIRLYSYHIMYIFFANRCGNLSIF